MNTPGIYEWIVGATVLRGLADVTVRRDSAICFVTQCMPGM
jgi:hypothetical protein